MNKPTLFAGILTAVAICLYPPWTVVDHSTTPRDGTRIAVDGNGVVGDSSRPVRPAVKIMHRGVFMPNQWTSPDGEHTYTAHIHVGRTVLQILAAVLIFGALAYGIGPLRHKEDEVQRKVQEYDQNL